MTLAIAYRGTAELVPYARNARTHSDEQIAKIMASIREFGFTNPILLDGENGVLAGHGRLIAAQRLGLAQVPTIDLAHLSPAQRRAYVLADNRLALDAGWDEQLLGLELLELKDASFDLDLLGFNELELQRYLGIADAQPSGLTDPDAAPPLPAEPVSRPGDLWRLGNHRVICGSSTDAHTVERVLDGVRPHLMVTDPPYGVGYDPAWRSAALQDGAQRAEGKVTNDHRADWTEAWALFGGDVAYVWHGDKQLVPMAGQLQDSGFGLRSLIVWAKPRLVLGRGHYHSQHETCWYAIRQGKAGQWQGDRSQTTLWSIEHLKSDTGHATQKPVECMRRPIENNASPGQAVYEPFCGSGTTILAGTLTGNPVHAIEIEPAYVDVAVERWQAYTGQAATLDGDGRTFGELKDGRCAA